MTGRTRDHRSRLLVAVMVVGLVSVVGLSAAASVSVIDRAADLPAQGAL
jgi:hypothetical protein